MKKRSMLVAAALLWSFAADLQAQSVTPGNERAGGSPGGGGVGIPADTPGNWVCVREMQPATRTAYSSICRKYCAPGCCSLRSMFRGCFGGSCDRCADGACEVRTRNVLVKKIVPDGDRPACVLKQGEECAACQPGPKMNTDQVHPNLLPPATLLPGTVVSPPKR